MKLMEYIHEDSTYGSQYLVFIMLHYLCDQAKRQTKNPFYRFPSTPDHRTPFSLINKKGLRAFICQLVIFH